MRKAFTLSALSITSVVFFVAGAFVLVGCGPEKPSPRNPDATPVNICASHGELVNC